MTFSLNQVVSECMKLEGERFKLFKRIDDCRSIYDYPWLQKELYQLNVKITQYQNAVKEMQELSSVKRRMRK